MRKKTGITEQNPELFCQCNQCLQILQCHAKYDKGGFSQAAEFSSLPLQACSVWPRNIERYSTANWGRGQNKRITKKKKKKGLREKHREAMEVLCTGSVSLSKRLLIKELSNAS